jgi:hypothetical protein
MSNFAILIYPSGNRFDVIDADSYDPRTCGHTRICARTLEDAMACAAVDDERWPQTPLVEKMREQKRAADEQGRQKWARLQEALARLEAGTLTAADIPVLQEADSQ